MTYDKDPVKIDITKEDVPPALLMKVRLPRLGYFPENRKKNIEKWTKISAKKSGIRAPFLRVQHNYVSRATRLRSPETRSPL